MLPRARWLICLACLGCHSISNVPVETSSRVEPMGSVADTAKPALEIKPNHLSIAAAALARGDDAQAIHALTEFVAVQPNHPNARFFLAELLIQRGQHAEARMHYEQTIAACQAESQADHRHLLHCHGRLLAIAEVLDDEYEIQLQRGIGLVLLAQMRAALGDPDGNLPVETLLCRAAGCLATAHALDRDAARPAWYLHCVWRQLAQPQPAQRWLRTAHAAASFSYLAPVEQRELMLAASQDLGIRN